MDKTHCISNLYFALSFLFSEKNNMGEALGFEMRQNWEGDFNALPQVGL